MSDELHAKFPAWRLKEVADLQPDDQQFWQKAHPKECPGIATGRFRRPSDTSYARLMVPVEGAKLEGYRLLVATPQSARRYDFHVLDQHDAGNSDGMALSTAPPGNYSDFEQTKSVHIQLDSINVEWIEKAAALYYRTGNRWRMLQTSD